MDTPRTPKTYLPLPIEDDTLIRRADLPLYIPVASQTFARWASENEGPRFLKLGRRLVAYRVADIKEWLQSNERDNTITSEDNG